MDDSPSESHGCAGHTLIHPVHMKVHTHTHTLQEGEKVCVQTTMSMLDMPAQRYSDTLDLQEDLCISQPSGR